MRDIEYSKLIEPHKRALATLELELEFFLTDVGNVDVLSIDSRLKTLNSAVSKRNKIDVPLEELDDLAGIRIVVGTTNDLPIVERFFTRQEYSKDLKVIKRNEYQRITGYRALHLVVELCSSYRRSITPGRVEVQIQTIFDNAFNCLSRSWRYKSNSKLDNEWDCKFIELSDALNKLENIASQLHTKVIEASSIEDDDSLTPHSLKMIYEQEFEENISYEDATDSCRLYSDLDCKTNGHLRNFFRNKEVVDLWDFVVNNSLNNPPLSQMVSMGKGSFWSMFGLRISAPSTKEFFEALAEKGRLGQEIT